MTLTTAVLLSLLAAGAATTEPDAGEAAASEEYAQVIIRQRVVLRVPTRTPQTPIEWREKKAPRCVPMTAIGGAAVTKPSSVDLILKGGTRLRAHLESDCPALDYYSGFYIAPTADGRICEDRDTIHARSGGECQITRFRTLVRARRNAESLTSGAV